MEQEIVEIVESDFDEQDRPVAIKALASVTLQHVMAESEDNLRNTRLAILGLSRGDLNQLKQLVEHAKSDFRDVIYWAMLEDKKGEL